MLSQNIPTAEETQKYDLMQINVSEMLEKLTIRGIRGKSAGDLTDLPEKCPPASKSI